MTRVMWCVVVLVGFCHACHGEATFGEDEFDLGDAQASEMSQGRTEDAGEPVSTDMMAHDADLMPGMDLDDLTADLTPRADMQQGPCVAMPDDTYCGGALPGQDAEHTLYTCLGGALVNEEVCAAICAVRDAGESDLCVDDQNEPCHNDADGVYCGGHIGASVERESLYHCVNRRTVSISACSSWCHGRPNQDDVCADNAVDACFDDIDGDFCGSYIGASSRGDDLYSCRGKRTASIASCAHGCESGGSPHRCKAAPNVCLARPPGTFTRGFNACGGGGFHHGIDLGSPVNTPIPAGMSGEVVSIATGHPNCPYNYNTGTCPSYCINNFNYVKIKVDGGNPKRAGHDLYLYYLHVSHLAGGVGVGSRVTRGDEIAYVGNSGCSTGPHIHLETVSVPAGQAAYLQTCNSFDPSSIYCP